jgi:hypothetical protein
MGTGNCASKNGGKYHHGLVGDEGATVSRKTSNPTFYIKFALILQTPPAIHTHRRFIEHYVAKTVQK